MTTLIQRTIYLDSFEDFDSQNIGNHWTCNLNYTHHGGGQYGVSKIESKIKVRLTADVSLLAINEGKTKESNENFASESEVVLMLNQEIQFQMSVSKYSTNNECWCPLNRETRHIIHYGNTGTRIDDWAK